MTTARPQTQQDVEPGQEPSDAEGWALLDGLRRRLDDQGTQARKTSVQVTQLAESIAALVDLQRKRSRWLNLNSFVAYLMFTLLCAGAFYYLFQTRARSLVDARDRAATERDAAVRRADEATAHTAARDAADAKAWEAWQLLDGGKRDEAAKRIAALQAAPLSKFEHEVLIARVKQADLMQVDAALKSASSAFRAGKYNEVVVTLESALTLQGAAPRAPEMHYLIGLSELKANEIDKAVTQLQAAVNADVAEDDARFELAAALDRVGQWAKARVEYDRFATAHPQSPSAVFAMRRSAMLARMPAEAPWVLAQKQGGAGQPTAQPAGQLKPSPSPTPSPNPNPNPNPGPSPNPNPTPPPTPATLRQPMAPKPAPAAMPKAVEPAATEPAAP